MTLVTLCLGLIGKKWNYRQCQYIIGMLIILWATVGQFVFVWVRNGNKTHFNKLIYKGEFGLGHRLARFSAAHHLALQWKLPILQADWGTCKLEAAKSTRKKEQDIFQFLFGGENNQINLPLHAAISNKNGNKNYNNEDFISKAATPQHNIGNAVIRVTNDVLGYYTGQSYKNAKKNLPPNYYAIKNNTATTNATTRSNSPWLDKMQSDQQLFQHLLDRFQHQKELQSFQNLHAWRDRMVIGLHIRAGNSEGTNFVIQGRDKVLGKKNFVPYVVKLIGAFIMQEKQQYRQKYKHNPLLFLATDTAAIIPAVKEAVAAELNNSTLMMTVVTFPQPRISFGGGVSFERWKSGQRCLEGWLASMSDQALLATTDVVVAASRSTFTQTLPMSMVLPTTTAEAPPEIKNLSPPETMIRPLLRFCEVGESGRRMTCFADKYSWLYRLQPGAVRTIQTFDLEEGTLPDKNENNRNNKRGVVRESNSNSNSLASLNDDQIIHKVVIHLPDWEVPNDFEKVERFLSSAAARHRNTLKYGNRFNTKYRGKVFREYSSHWTLHQKKTTET